MFSIFNEKPGLAQHETGPYLHHRVNPLQIGSRSIPKWNMTRKIKCFSRKYVGNAPPQNEC